jgi:ectoine hydroxylase-related dioxygenase (phytanoyl-CoA dioxygenase family)
LAVDTAVNHSTARFAESGYVVVPDVLGAAEAAELHRAFDDLPFVIEESEIIGWRAEAAERDLVGDERFLRLATNRRLLEPLLEIIGEDVQLIDYVAMEIGPRSGKRRAWHVDFPFFTSPVCLSAIAAVYLSDMTPAMGPLRVVPGSHARRRVPTDVEKEAELVGEVELDVAAGTAVVFDSQLWHTGTRNESGRPRRALFLHYAHYWMKRMDEFFRRPLPEAVTESGEPLVRQLFGLELAATPIWGPGYTRDREHVRV